MVGSAGVDDTGTWNSKTATSSVPSSDFKVILKLMLEVKIIEHRGRNSEKLIDYERMAVVFLWQFWDNLYRV